MIFFLKINLKVKFSLKNDIQFNIAFNEVQMHTLLLLWGPFKVSSFEVCTKMVTEIMFSLFPLCDQENGANVVAQVSKPKNISVYFFI